MTPLSINSRTDRALALAIELIAFYIRVIAWLLLIWAPFLGVCMLLFAHDQVIRYIAVPLLSMPLLGLLLKWMSTGIFDLKLGRMIVMLLVSAGFALLELVVIVFQGITLQPVVVGLVGYSLVAAILGCGLIRRNHLLR